MSRDEIGSRAPDFDSTSAETTGAPIDYSPTFLSSRNVLAEALDDEGSAGGHQEMAGGTIPLGPFATTGIDSDTAERLATKAVYSRVFDALQPWT